MLVSFIFVVCSLTTFRIFVCCLFVCYFFHFCLLFVVLTTFLLFTDDFRLHSERRPPQRHHRLDLRVVALRRKVQRSRQRKARGIRLNVNPFFLNPFFFLIIERKKIPFEFPVFHLTLLSINSQQFLFSECQM